MTCYKCPFYKASPSSNGCSLLDWENCRTSDDCIVMNDDGTVNQAEFNKIKMFL